ncbi:MAG TPA: AAA family ATPase, partial [Nitrosomonas sp.]|nr:AAA family ATPase [Nitrosomonas sp.]
MAKRIFDLPKEQDLTKDQRIAIRKPADGQYLVVGAPGTGKSVVALWRLKKYADEKEIQFLTFNHVLNHANRALVGDSQKYEMNTAMSWLYDLHWKLVDGNFGNFNKNKMPQISSYQPDYKKLMETFKSHNVDRSNLSLIIDEGQDLPPAWYVAVEELNIENFFVVADQNQQITDQNSSHDELIDLLGLEKADVIHLKENWRNTTPIAAFANYFYTDKSSLKPELPNKPSVHAPILYEYQNLDSVKEIILSSYDNDPSKLLGLIVANDCKREWWSKELKKDDKIRRESAPIINTYDSSQKNRVHIDFDQGGIVVLNDKSVKGIEFDEVFIIID